MLQKLFVVPETVQLVKNRETFGLISVERRGKDDAVRNIAPEDSAWNGVAFGPAGSEWRRDAKEAKEKADSSLRSEGPFQGGVAKSHKKILLVAECLDRIEARGARGGIKSCGKADENSKTDSKKDEPPGNGRNVDPGKILAMQVEIGAESERAADEPAEKRSKHAAEKAHDTGFDKEKLLDVAVGGAKGFQDADFAAALEDGHDERIDDAKRGNGKSQAAEDAEKKIEDGEENAQAFRSVEKRERAEAEILELGLCGLHERRTLDAHGKARVGGLVARRIAENVAEVVDLRGAECFRERERNEQAAARKAAET